ncbi:Tn3 family transposase [Actinoplanes utahensis]
MRNLNEGRHDLARHVFHGRRGELHRAYHDGMEDQLGALGLVLNCITLWNTVYLDLALAGLRGQGYPVLGRRPRPALAVRAPPHPSPRPLHVRPARPRRAHLPDAA